jgi:hypothetical protein
MEDEYGQIRNEMIFVVAKSGWGKGLAVEGFIEEYHRAGYIVLILADPKNEIELGYAQFLPKERYHLDALKKEGKKPEKKKVKLYHPFTFRLPRQKIPDYNFFTLSLKELGRKEWGMIAESGWDTDTIKLLLNASQNLTDETGLYGFIHSIQDMVKGNKEERSMRPDPKNFYLSITGGTLKSIQDISNYLQPFKKDYFLAKQNCSINLNMKQILTDQESYHVFVSNYIKDEKLKEFVILTIFNKIIENKDIAKKPLLIVIPEIRYLVPFKPQGYKLFLAQGIKDNLSMMRSMGRGMTALLDTQVFSGVDEEVSNSATVTLFGELGGARDIDKVAKSLNYKRDIRSQLSHMEKPNSYLIAGMEDVGAIRCWFPRHRHCEPHYNFAENFEKDYPERMKSYADLSDQMRKDLKEDEDKIREKIRKQEQRDRERREAIRKARESADKEKNVVEKKITEAKTSIDKSKLELMRLIYEAHQREPQKSMRDLSRDFGIHHTTIKKYISKYQEEQKKKDAQDIQDQVLEELEGGEDDGGESTDE